MAIQIQGRLQSPQQPDNSPIVGIDLGTTHSLVALVRDGKPEVLSSREGRNLVPSVVSWDLGEGSSGAPVIGYQAKHRKLRDPRSTIYSVKRLLGRSFEDLAAVADQLPYSIEPGQGGLVKIRVGDRSYSAIEISAMILKELKETAQAALGVPVSRAVITVPAYFNDSQRQATRTAGRLAGLDVLRIVNEPTAAALAYGLTRKKEGLIAVYDLGGGTFDISILKLHDGIFEVLSTHGDTALGGDDLDIALAQAAAAEIRARVGTDPMLDVESRAALLESAERAKIALSENEEAVMKLDLPTGQFTRKWTRAEFDALARPALERTRRACEQALLDAGISPQELSDVVMVGGPTRLPIVQEVAREIFGVDPNTAMHPDEVVAQGAAIQADILAGKNREFLLLDIVPLSLGIETYGGVMSVLIPRNTPVPTSAREVFTTFVDNQTGVDIHVLQGEREQVELNRSLARFKLKGIKPMPAGAARIEVTFMIDADGILQVSAKDLHTRAEQTVEVRPSHGLTDSEVEKMLEAGLSHQREDHEFRDLVEARNQAEPLLRAAEKRLPEAERLLAPDEFEQVRTSVESLRAALQGTSAPDIRNASKTLDASTSRLADLLMNEAIATGLKNRSATEVMKDESESAIVDPKDHGKVFHKDHGKTFRK